MNVSIEYMGRKLTLKSRSPLVFEICVPNTNQAISSVTRAFAKRKQIVARNIGEHKDPKLLFLVSHGGLAAPKLNMSRPSMMGLSRLIWTLICNMLS